MWTTSMPRTPTPRSTSSDLIRVDACAGATLLSALESGAPSETFVASNPSSTRFTFPHRRVGAPVERLAPLEAALEFQILLLRHPRLRRPEHVTGKGPTVPEQIHRRESQGLGGAEVGENRIGDLEVGGVVPAPRPAHIGMQPGHHV